jgi:endogenous inhibitor of DNA gyrase (YacG/DUF329 family)
MSQQLKPPHLVEKLKHNCACCGKEFYWTEESRWYGNYQIHGVGYQAWEEENVQDKVCGLVCLQSLESMKSIHGKHQR